MEMRDQLAEGLSRLSAIARQEDWRASECEGLTPTQGDMLRILASRPAGMRLTQLAAQIRVSQPTASDALSALERKQLVEKLPDPSDGRALLARATAEGRTLAGRWPPGFGPVIDALSPGDQVLLHGVVCRAILRLQQRGAIPMQRMCFTCRNFLRDAHPGEMRPHHCRLIDTPIGDQELRIDCPEHDPEHAEA